MWKSSPAGSAKDMPCSGAAGDSENDLSMLQAAATGILMRNGAEMNPYLKEGADLVTDYDNDQDGLARTLASILDRIDA